MEEKFGFRTMGAPPPLRQEEDKDKVEIFPLLTNWLPLFPLFHHFCGPRDLISLISLRSSTYPPLSSQYSNHHDDDLHTVMVMVDIGIIEMIAMISNPMAQNNDEKVK